MKKYIMHNQDDTNNRIYRGLKYRVLSEDKHYYYFFVNGNDEIGVPKSTEDLNYSILIKED